MTANVLMKRLKHKRSIYIYKRDSTKQLVNFRRFAFFNQQTRILQKYRQQPVCFCLLLFFPGFREALCLFCWRLLCLAHTPFSLEITGLAAVFQQSVIIFATTLVSVLLWGFSSRIRSLLRRLPPDPPSWSSQTLLCPLKELGVSNLALCIKLALSNFASSITGTSFLKPSFVH